VILELRGAHLALARERLHTRPSGSSSGETVRTVVEHALVAAGAPAREDVRDAANALRHTFVRAPDPGRTALHVGPDADWFRVADRPTVSLASRSQLRRLLWVLVQAHQRRPRAALTVHGAFAQAWPGERAASAAAANRVYVGISRLRTAGLRDVIRHNGDGFEIAAGVRVIVERAGAP
jgi:hypothetical protein